MGHKLQHITDLAEILFAQNVEDVVVSPGSRNAPLIRAFYDRFGARCKSLVDERSAGYFALGQSLATKKPAVLISTSGTAVLNYAPAIAEAFYQKVPLLVITADRPAEWIGQQDNQAINQQAIYKNYIKASYSLPVDTSGREDLWLAHRLINEAFHTAVSASPGPVHINVPLREPLYENLPAVSTNISVIHKQKTVNTLSENSLLHETWKRAKSIMIVCGQLPPDKNLKEAIKNLSADSRLVLVAEPVSNFHEIATIANPEVTLNSKINYPEEAIPDLIIYFGGQVISKKIKLFLRGLQHSKFWFISPEEQIIDTFQNINSFIQAEPISVLNGLSVETTDTKNSFRNFWEKEVQNAVKLKANYTGNISYSDLLVFKTLSQDLPNDAIVFAGNSSVVRYLLYFDQKQRKYYSNRGVSGIDGCLSSAAGLASKLNEPVFAIVGDSSFVYDSNALWNRDFPENLKIILINNDGGGIFHLLKGPSEHEAFHPLVNAHHAVDFKKLTEAFGLDYQLCTSKSGLKPSIEKLVLGKQNEVLEIRTFNNGEPQITKDFFNYLNTNYGTEMDDT